MAVLVILTQLTKLRKAAHAIKNSTTLILPEWFRILGRMAKASQEKGNKPLGLRVMPRDVATRWNSTYEMLDFAYKYRKAYNEITANRNMNLRTYELSNEDWKIVKDLATVLKVRTLIYFKIF